MFNTDVPQTILPAELEELYSIPAPTIRCGVASAQAAATYWPR